MIKSYKNWALFLLISIFFYTTAATMKCLTLFFPSKFHIVTVTVVEVTNCIAWNKIHKSNGS